MLLFLTSQSVSLSTHTLVFVCIQQMESSVEADAWHEEILHSHQVSFSTEEGGKTQAFSLVVQTRTLRFICSSTAQKMLLLVRGKHSAPLSLFTFHKSALALCPTFQMLFVQANIAFRHSRNSPIVQCNPHSMVKLTQICVLRGVCQGKH